MQSKKKYVNVKNSTKINGKCKIGCTGWTSHTFGVKCPKVTDFGHCKQGVLVPALVQAWHFQGWFLVPLEGF